MKPIGTAANQIATSSQQRMTTWQSSDPSAQAWKEQRQAQEDLALERARLLFGQFRKGDANDAKTFTMSVAAVLAEFSCEVILKVTDPRSGLASRQQFLPTIREVFQSCKEWEDHFREQSHREAEALKHAEEGRKWNESKAAPRGKAVADYLAKRKADNGGSDIWSAPMGAPLPADMLLARYLHQKAMFPKVTLSPDAAAILDAAGIDWRNMKPAPVKAEPKRGAEYDLLPEYRGSPSLLKSMQERGWRGEGE